MPRDEQMQPLDVVARHVFEHFDPKLSQESKDADVLFLANILPELQRNVRRQCDKARFVALDEVDPRYVEQPYYLTPGDDYAAEGYLVIREALLREHYRGGQSFFVAPRIASRSTGGV